MPENPLHVIMTPSSIAVVGASNNVMKMGTIQCLNLIHSGFPGEIMPVHPSERTVLGRKAWPRICDLPSVPELAVLVVPTLLVPDMLEDFGKLGTRHAVIISGGFRELGHEGRELEKRIVQTAKCYGMRFLGPNCIGIINTELPINLTVLPLHRPGKGLLGIASQSGTYVTQTLPYIGKNGILISKAISVGNEANIDIVDCIEYLGEDKETKAIALYVEGIRQADAFLAMARKVSRKKPIIAQYVGGTEAGARSGSSHTGAMAGPDHVYDGLFRQSGIIRVETIEEVYKVGWALATQPPPSGSRVAVLTNSGGPGTAIAMACNKNGMDVPEFSKGVQKKIKEHLPRYASPRNPVDLTFHIEMSALTEKIPKILFEADEIDGVIIHGIMKSGFLNEIYPVIKGTVDVPQNIFDAISKVDLEPLLTMAKKSGKPLVVSSFFDEDDNCLRKFHEEGVPTFSTPEMAAKAMACLYRYEKMRSREVMSGVKRMPLPEESSRIMKGLENDAMDEYLAKKVLASCGIPVTREFLVRTKEEARRAALEVGFPVVLKACSPQLHHKTEDGLVCLDIGSEKALESSFARIRKKKKNVPLLLSEMVYGDREFMAGVSRLKGFPPCVMFGLGGVFAEALKDRVIRMAPLESHDVRDMVGSISGRALLGPYRGMKKVKMSSLEQILITLGDIAMHFPRIREIDLNPIIIRGNEPVVADALFVMD